MARNNSIGMIAGLALLAAVVGMIGSVDALSRTVRVPFDNNALELNAWPLHD